MSSRMKSSSSNPDFVADVALQCGDGGFTAPDEPCDDGSIGLDGGGRHRPASRRGLSSGSGEEVTALEDGLQRVPDQRIGSPKDLQEAGAVVGEPARATSTNSLPPASAMGRGVVSCQKESPRGFMASVIIC